MTEPFSPAALTDARNVADAVKEFADANLWHGLPMGVHYAPDLIRRLVAEVERLQAELRDLTCDHSDEVALRADLAKVWDAMGIPDDRRSDIEFLVGGITGMVDRARQHRTEIAKLHRESADHADRARRAATTIATLRLQLGVGDEAHDVDLPNVIAALKAEIVDLRERADHYEAEAKRWEAETGNRKQEAEAWKRQAKKLNLQVEDLGEAVRMVERDRDQRVIERDAALRESERDRKHAAGTTEAYNRHWAALGEALGHSGDGGAWSVPQLISQTADLRREVLHLREAITRSMASPDEHNDESR